MKQLRLPIFTSEIKIYNLRIVPPDPVYDDIVSLKKQFETVFGKQPLSKSKPHITIAAFRMNSKHQDVIVKIFNQLSQIEKFKLRIEGFDIFKNNSNTLYLKVSKTKDVQRTHENVRNLCDALDRRLESLTISDTPHITISKTTGTEMLLKSLAHFQKTNYSKEFEVGHLTLVSRSKYKTWDWEHRFELA